MLLELSITDFAIIDHVRLEFTPAFNVLTGETGAGKSIMIDALGMLRGERTDPTFVRAGSPSARVEGIFSLHDRRDIVPLLQEYGLHDDEDEQVILTREINAASGRSVARINGRAVNSAVLREIGGRLVDIHGQHEGLALFNTRTHADMLDRYGNLIEQRNAVGQIVERLEHVRVQINSLRQAEARRIERIEELEYLIADLQAAKLKPGEEEQLSRERSLLQNSARITNAAESAYRLLKAGGTTSERKPPTRPIIDALEEVTLLIGELARLDTQLEGLNEQALEVRYRLDDVIDALRTYRDSLEFEPGRLEAIEDRLAELRELTRRYRVGDSNELLQLLQTAEAELEQLHHSAEHIADLEAQERTLLGELGQAASALHEQRRQAGDTLAQRIQQAVHDLAMPNIKFYVQLSQRPDPSAGVRVNLSPEPVAFDRTGIDGIEFLLSPNPGEPLKPLARIASGGESARLLLAMKSILSAVDAVPTLVFDEVDVGVGGRSGQVVGEKLWGLTEAHQVLCITHLPQVAAFGDQHFSIAKRVVNNRTQTTVRPLKHHERVDELAAMLDGTPISDASRQSAAEMLERAQSYKHSRANALPIGS